MFPQPVGFMQAPAIGGGEVVIIPRLTPANLYGGSGDSLLYVRDGLVMETDDIDAFGGVDISWHCAYWDSDLGYFVAGASSGTPSIVRSDNGEPGTWTAVGVPPDFVGSLMRMWSDDNGNLYLSYFDGVRVRVYRSQNSGTSWTQVWQQSGFFGGLSINDPAPVHWDPINDVYLAQAADSGDDGVVTHSTDAAFGSPTETTLEASFFCTAFVSDTTNNQVLAAFSGSIVWRNTDPSNTGTWDDRDGSVSQPLVVQGMSAGAGAVAGRVLLTGGIVTGQNDISTTSNGGTTFVNQFNIGGSTNVNSSAYSETVGWLAIYDADDGILDSTDGLGPWTVTATPITNPWISGGQIGVKSRNLRDG